MNLFNDLPIPRRTMAQDIARFLRDASDKPIHVSGPEGYGKIQLAQSLTDQLEIVNRPSYRDSLQGSAGQSGWEIINHQLLSSLAEETG